MDLYIWYSIYGKEYKSYYQGRNPMADTKYIRWFFHLYNTYRLYDIVDRSYYQGSIQVHRIYNLRSSLQSILYKKYDMVFQSKSCLWVSNHLYTQSISLPNHRCILYIFCDTSYR